MSDIPKPSGGYSPAVGGQFSTGLLLFLAGIACYIASLRAGETGLHFVLFALAVGLAGVGVAALGFSNTFRTGHRKGRSAFRAMFRAAPVAAAYSDRDGAIIDLNMEGWAAFDSAPGASVSALFSGLSEHDGEALLYRLLRRLAQDARAIECFVDAEGVARRVTGLTCGVGIAWTVEPVDRDGPASGVSGLLDLDAIVFRTDENGTIVQMSPRAKALAGTATNLSDANVLKDGPLPTQQAFGRLNDETGARVRVMETAARQGGREFHLMPVDPEETAGALPEEFMDALPVALARIAADGALIYANEAARQLLGPDATPGAKLSDLVEGLGRSIPERISEMMRGRFHMRSEVARTTREGEELFLQVTLKRLMIDGDASLIAVISDATEFKALEAQFVQSQKMQAVGQLAGGVAHDFNNLLTAISGHCDLLLLRHTKADDDYNDLTQIRQNAMRAAALVGKLLAFSRKQTLMPNVVNLYDTLYDLKSLLNRLLGEKVTLRIEYGDDVPKVRVDERQIEAVIMNLVVNARDAMPDGGEVTIKTHEVTYSQNIERDGATIPFGSYLRVDVTDTGTGIPDDVIGKIFEPFFTTKGVGEGTGLGLSTAYGIIKQTGGFIFATSKVGVGTTFTILLPTYTGDSVESDGMHEAACDEPDESRDLTGRGVILLVEDEIPVRSFAARALNTRGYTVLEAASAEEALELLEDDKLHVDLFVSDVVMPGMDGPTWVKEARKTRPDAKVVFVSGYAEDAFGDGEMEIPNATFLPKPFSLNQLTHTVKEHIEA